MNPSETVRLARIIASIAPAQKIDEYTADMWQPILADVPLGDALAAIQRIGRRQPFIAPADICAEVKVIRRERLDKADSTFTYTGDPDDTAEYQRQLRNHIRAVGDGRELPPPPALPRAIRPKMLEQVFNGVPRVSLSRWPKSEPPPPRAPISEESLRQAREALAEAARDAERTGRLVGAVKPPEGRP